MWEQHKDDTLKHTNTEKTCMMMIPTLCCHSSVLLPVGGRRWEWWQGGDIPASLSQQAAPGVMPCNGVGGTREECCTVSSRRSLVQVTTVCAGEESCRAGLNVPVLSVWMTLIWLNVFLVVGDGYRFCRFEISLKQGFFDLFPILGSAHQVYYLHVLWSCASSCFTCFSFKSVA